MRNILLFIIAPFFMRGSFTSKWSSVSNSVSFVWLAICMAASLLSYFTIGQPGWLGLTIALSTPLCFVAFPSRLRAQLASIATLQQLLGISAVFGMVALGISAYTRNIVLLVLMAYSSFAAIKLILLYIRTPKADMP